MAKWDKEYLKLCRKILTEGKEVEKSGERQIEDR